MPGRKKRQKVLAELRRLAAAAEAETPLEYIVLMLESGETLLDICSRLSLVLGERVYAGAVQRMLIDEAGGMDRLTQRLNDARKRGAATLAEEAKSITDECDATPGGVAKARAQGDARQRLAEAWDRERFGSKASASLSINIGQLHLDALKQVNERRRVAQAAVDAQLLSPGIVEAEVEVEEGE